MAFLSNVSTRFWEYVSPRKTQQRRDKDFRGRVAPLPYSGRERGNAKSQLLPPTIKSTQMASDPIVPESSVNPVDLPPSPPHSLDRALSDMEGDTLIDDPDVIYQSKEVDSWDANEDTIVMDEDRYVVEEEKVDPEDERKRRDEQGQDLRQAGWTEDAIFLFQKLGMRGFEPLMPGDWIEDFKSLPYDLFTFNLDKAFIKPAFDRQETSANFHAFKALEDLFQLGGRARDSVHQKAEIRTPEKLIRRAIKDYNKWAVKDGGVENLWNQLSLFEVVIADAGTQSTQMESKMRRRLEKLAGLWREAFRACENQDDTAGKAKSAVIDPAPLPNVPTLYGVIASHTIMAFVSYDASAPHLLRTVAIFDFGQEGYDVWNSLAISIFVIHCRNRLMELKEFLPQVHQTAAESDPDL